MGLNWERDSLSTERKAGDVDSDLSRSVVGVVGDSCGHALLVASVFFSEIRSKTHLSEDGGESFGGVKRHEKVCSSHLEERMDQRDGVGLLTALRIYLNLWS